MKIEGFNLSLSFNQILELVRQLPPKQKVKLSKELEKETLDSKLAELLNVFQTDMISKADIEKEVQNVRSQRYEKKKNT